MIILLHTSKTMRDAPPADGWSSTGRLGTPALVTRAAELVAAVRDLTPDQIASAMKVSLPLAGKTHDTFAAWTTDPDRLMPAAESFLGDIYSGLRVASWSAADRRYATAHLRILSGLYGVLRPFDGISPYRLEMGYRLPVIGSLYSFWGSAVAAELPSRGPIVNLAANEYSKVVLPFVDAARVVTPRFLTVEPASGEPKFVAVHAKIARGAFARWLVMSGGSASVGDFAELGYRLDPDRGTDREPCFVCTEFAGKGLSVRLT
ncbi:YaaA family protein [Luedemannella helvata]|uniref:UPF0246 protein GCM10009681_11320 n=1 Tax=Luedemannella helvata TaxID=349315 RepID=A0ABP4W1E5_9ACTN